MTKGRNEEEKVYLAEDVGKKIKAVRKEKKLTQENVFTAIGSDKSTYSQFENGVGNPTLKYITKVANFLEIEVELLIKKKSEE